MNPFITPAELTAKLSGSANLVYCVPLGESPAECISGSMLYYVADESAKFIQTAKSLEIDEDKAVVVYDNGELATACKAYWGFRATGHDDVRILAGGLKACAELDIELQADVTQIPLTDPFLPYNNAVIISYQDFVKKESYYQQVIYAEKLSFDVIDAKGSVISEQQIVKGLEMDGISLQINKATIVHGPFATIVGVLLKYLGQRSVAVVIDKTEGFVSAKKLRKSQSARVEDLELGNAKNIKSVPPFESENSKNKPIEEQSRCICSCLIF